MQKNKQKINYEKTFDKIKFSFSALCIFSLTFVLVFMIGDHFINVNWINVNENSALAEFLEFDYRYVIRNSLIWAILTIAIYFSMILLMTLWNLLFSKEAKFSEKQKKISKYLAIVLFSLFLTAIAITSLTLDEFSIISGFTSVAVALYVTFKKNN